MKVACVYSVDGYETPDKPLANSSQIPFGLAIISTILKKAEHDVSLFVLSPASKVEQLVNTYIAENKPAMFCLTAVSSQFKVIENVARIVKEADPNIYVVLGGHHASLAPDDAIESPHLDAICLGEGDDAIIELASQVESGTKVPTGIPHLWIKDKESGAIEKNPNTAFNEDLDSLPLVDRSLWEPWTVAPQDEVSILIGRGCPYKCTYCSNHAMQKLSKGKYVRYRSPEAVIKEIDTVCREYPDLRRIYLETETIGGSIDAALALFGALAEYNSNRSEKLSFGMNLAIHSTFVKKEEKVRQLLEYCKKANVVGLNVGLESGSPKIRKVLRRPHYTNDELIHFTTLASEYGINVTLYVLIGLPQESPRDFMETVEVTRKIQPAAVYLAIFYPYIGTDLYDLAYTEGMIPAGGIETSAERRTATINLPSFPNWRVRYEYVVFWWRVYRGNWSYTKIFGNMARHFIQAHPSLESTYKFAVNHNNFVSALKKRFSPHRRDGVRRPVLPDGNAGQRLDM